MWPTHLHLTFPKCYHLLQVGHCLLHFPLSEKRKYSSTDSIPFKINTPPPQTKLETLPSPQTTLFPATGTSFHGLQSSVLALMTSMVPEFDLCQLCPYQQAWCSLIFSNSAWWQLIPVKVKSCAWRVLSDQSLSKHIQKSQHIMSEDVHFPGRVDELALRNVCF